MKLSQKFVVHLLFFIPFLGFSQFTDEINSNRPGKSMMAYSVGKSVFQVEMGANYMNEDHTSQNFKADGFMGEVDFRWGLFFEQLEFIAEFQYQNDQYTDAFLAYERSALKKSILGLKFLIYDPFKNYEEKINIYSWKANHRFKWRQLLPSVAVYGGANLNFSDNPFIYIPLGTPEPIVSPKATICLQNQFEGRWVLVTNISYNKIATEFSSIDYIVTLTKGFNEHWSGFIENQGFNGDYYSDGILKIGAAYLVSKNFQVDASIGKNIKTTPDLFSAGLGLSWRFTKNYTEVKIKKNKGSKMDEKVQKKKEKEAKNREKNAR